MPVLLVSLAVLVFGAMLYRYFTVYANQNTPVTVAKAKLLRKETHVSTQIDAGGAVVSSDVHQLTFTLETGGEMAFTVSPKAYENTPENEWGTLTYQGTRFVGFEFRSE